MVGEDDALNTVLIGEDRVFNTLDAFDDHREVRQLPQPGEDFPINKG